MDLGLPVRPSDDGHLGLGADDRATLLVEECRLTADTQVAACAGTLGQVDELLGMLRGIEEGAELLHLLAGHDGVGVTLHGLIPFGERQLYGGGQFILPLGLVFLVCFLASASAALAVMPNTANVLMDHLIVSD